MERDSSPFIPLQQDEIPINYSDFSIYEVGFHQDYGKNKISHNLEKSGDARSTNEELEKKIMHREIERERRKEMTALYASLRSVLPSKTIKGLRSASDQIDGATKYIRYMQNKIRQLEMKREKIKKWSENEKLGLLGEKGVGVGKNLLGLRVRVQRCTVGVEVLISCGIASETQRRLSGILQLLLQEGLDVVDCNSTNFNGTLHYEIRSQVLTCSSIDLQVLQAKLIRGIEEFGDQS